MEDGTDYTIRLLIKRAKHKRMQKSSETKAILFVNIKEENIIFFI